MKAFLLVLFVLCVYPCDGQLVSLAPNLVEKIDIKTSKDILNQIVETINTTVNDQNELALSCETAINKTIASCETCAADFCQQQSAPSHQQIFIALISEVKKSLTTAAKLVINIGSHLNVSNNLDMDFLAKLSDVTDTIEKTLLGGAEQAFTDVITELEETGKTITIEAGKSVVNFAKGFGKFGARIKEFAGKTGSGIGGVVKQLGFVRKLIGNVGGGVPNTREKVRNRIEKVGTVFADVRQSIGNALKSIFGKRSTRHILQKRCVQSCPDCDTLDTKTHSQDKIIEKVCGQPFMSKQKEALDTLKSLEEVYNYIQKENPVVTKFEFDKTSIVFQNGSVLFNTSFVTFQVGTTSNRFKLPGMFNVGNNDNMAVEISKEVRKNIF